MFDRFEGAVVSGGNVAFRGDQIGEFGLSQGIYLHTGGDLLKVIATGDELDGREVTLLAGPSFDGNQLAFRADFASAPFEGIFVATVPEPHAALSGVFAFAVVVLIAARRRNRDT
jgi:hypothetical protein